MPSCFPSLIFLLALLLPWTISGVETTLALSLLCLVGSGLVRGSWPSSLHLVRPLLAPLGLYCGSQLLSNFYAASIGELPLNPGTLLSPVWISLVLLLPPIMLEDEARASRAVSILIGAGALVSVYGIAQYFSGIDLARAHPLTREVIPHSGRFRVIGFYSHPLTFAYAYAFILSFALARALYAEQPLERTLTIGAAILIEIALWLSGGRAAWLAVTAWTVALLLIHRPWRSASRSDSQAPDAPAPGSAAAARSSLSRRLAPLLLILVPAAMMAGSTTLRERAADSVQLEARRPRLLFWKIAAHRIERAPLLGTGSGSFRKDATPELVELAPDVTPPRHAHQTYLQLWIEGGLGALLGMSWLFVRWLKMGARGLRNASRTGRGLALGALGGLATFLVGGLTQDTLGDAEVHRMLAFSCGVLVAVCGSSPIGAGADQPVDSL